jgi:hypothetical protein
MTHPQQRGTPPRQAVKPNRRDAWGHVRPTPAKGRKPNRGQVAKRCLAGHFERQEKPHAHT